MTRQRSRGVAAVVVASLIALLALWLWFARDAEHLSASDAPVSAAPPEPATQPVFAASDPALSAEGDGPQPLASRSDAAVSATPSADGATSLRVRVIWAADKTPAVGVGLQIYFWREAGGGYRNLRRVTTDARGEWFASPVPTGTVGIYTDRDEKAGTKIEPGQAALIEIALPPGLGVRGLVQDADGAPVADADVWLSMPQNSEEGQVVARSDARGRFDLRDLPPTGRQVLAARCRLHGPSPPVTVHGVAGQTRDVVLVLGGECGAVRGVVLDPDGRPVPGARVTVGEDYGIKLGDQSRAPPFDLRCDAQGTFLAEGLPVGVHPIAAAAPGWSPTDQATGLVKGQQVRMTGVLVEAGQTADVTLQLQPSASLSGTVRDDAGQPVFWAQVSIDAPRELLCAEASTGKDGRYEIHDVPVGSFAVHARHEDVVPLTTTLRFVAGQALTWDPQLTQGGRLAGTLLDAGGAPASHRAVVAQPLDRRGGLPAGATTDDNGRFEIQSIDADTVDVVLIQSNGRLLLASGVAVGQTDLVLRMPEGADLPATVTGRVVDPLGVPVAACDVWIESVATSSSWQAPIDAATGRFALTDLSPGRFVAHVAAPPAPDVTSPALEVAGGQSGDFGDLVVVRGGRVSLLLTAPGAIEDQRVLAVLISETGGSGAKLSRDGDRWMSTYVPAGQYTLFLRPLDFAPVRKPVVVEEGRDTLVDVSLQACVQQQIRVFGPRAKSGGTSFSLTIHDAGGDAVISIPAGKLPAATETSAPDEAALDVTFCLAPGAYVVDASLASKSATAVPFSTSPGVPWDIDLR